MFSMRWRSNALVMAVLLLGGYFWLTAAPLYSQSDFSIIYRSPAPNTQFHPPSTTIAVRYNSPLPDIVSPQIFTVEGQQTGLHRGAVVQAADGRTLIFKPDQPFQLGEVVTVILASPVAGRTPSSTAGETWIFQISLTESRTSANEDFLHSSAASLDQMQKPNFPSAPPYHTVPDDFPVISVTVPTSGTAPGYLFLGSFAVDWNQGSVDAVQPYLLILDDNGEPVFYQRMEAGRPVLDFKVQPSGMLTYARWGGPFFVMDTFYRVIDTIAAGNGYATDIHDLQILPNGNALLMIYDAQPVDMSQIVPGGNPDAIVTGLVIQELDTSKNVVFQWRSWDHILITDSSQDLTTARIDYVHGNALELDTDGNILLSSRWLDEVTKIDRETGLIIWRLGGKKNQFQVNNDSAGIFYGQHDIRRLPNGNITLFDNRDRRSDFSRAVEYQLDEETKQATLVWEYRSPNVSQAMGNTQRLPNGNTMIGWGSMYPTLSEVRPDGSLALEMSFVPNVLPNIIANSYRVFRFPWTGKPVEPPTLVAESTQDGAVDLYYSWNGATDVVYYRVFGGNELDNMKLISIQARQGFESHSLSREDYCFYKIMPIGSDAQETVFSNTIMLESCVVQRLFLPLISYK